MPISSIPGLLFDLLLVVDIACGAVYNSTSDSSSDDSIHPYAFALALGLLNKGDSKKLSSESAALSILSVYCTVLASWLSH